MKAPHFIAAMVLAASPATADCKQTLAANPSLLRLASATSSDQLRRDFPSEPPDALSRFVYLVRLSDLAPTRDTDLRLISAVPKSREFVNALYELSYPDCPVTRTLSDLGGSGWLESVYRAVIRQEAGYEQFLALADATSDNADLTELMAGYFERLKAQAPSGFKAAYSKLSRQQREYMDALLSP